VLVHQLDLDRQLAAGTSRDASPALALRADQLLGTHVRHELAACIESVMARCEHPPHWHSAALPIQAAAVRAAGPDLERVRQALLDETTNGPAGVALASLLLHDEHSPVYAAGASTTVTELARAALAALRRGTA
jgi:hypothetical protein